MDNSLKKVLDVSAVVLEMLVAITLMTGCTARTGAHTSFSGQAMDGTNNPIYPPLAYTPVTQEEIDANGNPL